MCENLHYESVYFKELHNQQEYYSVLTDNIQNGGSCSVNEKQEHFLHYIVHFVNPRMFMLTFNVILGYQGLLFRYTPCDFLKVFFSFFFNTTDRPTSGNAFDAKRKKKGIPYLGVSWVWFSFLADACEAKWKPSPPPLQPRFRSTLLESPRYLFEFEIKYSI